MITFLRNLPIKYKLAVILLALMAIFMVSALYSFLTVRTGITMYIESELQRNSILIAEVIQKSLDVSIKNYLRAVTEKNIQLIEAIYQEYKDGRLTEDQARQQAEKLLLSQTIGSTGYNYCIDSRGVAVVHPNKGVLGNDYSYRGFIKKQITLRNGYLEYDWQNPGEPTPRPKALYMAYFEPWDWIVSVSSYRSEFAELVTVDDFRDSILNIRFGSNGYAFVLDPDGNILIHPNVSGNIRDLNMGEGLVLLDRILEQREGVIRYDWTDPYDEITRKKIVFVSYLEDFDWFICSSGYLEELYKPVQAIRNTIILAFLATVLLVVLVFYAMDRSISRPIDKLLGTIKAGESPEQTPRLEVASRDEFGELAASFNTFLDRISAYNEELKNEIDERRRTEDELRQLRNLMRNIIDSMPSILIGVDLNGVVTLWNRGAADLTGLTDKQAVGRSLDAVFPHIQGVADRVAAAVVRREMSRGERMRLGEKKDARYYEITLYPLTSKGSEGAVIRLDDVTEQVRIQEMMVQTEKMMSVGGLAAGMAHEINNPLGIILQTAQNTINRFSPDLKKNREVAREAGVDLERVREYMEKRKILGYLQAIREAGERAAKIVRSMLDFSRKSESRFAPCNINALIDHALELAAQDYDMKKRYDFRKIAIKREYADNLPEVWCSNTEIEQVILNLLKNSAHAIADQAPSAPPEIRLETHLNDRMVEIVVHDNGPGMDETTRRRVFEPFYTTKETGVGTGLGLSVSYYIVTTNHSGEMMVDSAPGQGARFIIRLPIDRADETA
jgi:two-component system NtrC family sensor kinase